MGLLLPYAGSCNRRAREAEIESRADPPGLFPIVQGRTVKRPHLRAGPEGLALSHQTMSPARASLTFDTAYTNSGNIRPLAHPAFPVDSAAEWVEASAAFGTRRYLISAAQKATAFHSLILTG